MKKLVIRGDPGIRRDAVIEFDGQEYVCFGVSRQGDWHGPDRPMLWCTIGSEDERETYDRRDYIPMHLETLNTDAESITVVEPA